MAICFHTDHVQISLSLHLRTQFISGNKLLILPFSLSYAATHFIRALNRSVAILALCCDLVGMAEQCGLCYPDPEESLTPNNSLLISSVAKNYLDE